MSEQIRNIHAEQAVLGGLLLSNESWDRIGDRIGASDFAHADHQEIFAAIRRKALANEPFDAVTLAETLPGHIMYIRTLVDNTPGAANIEAYADLVRDKSKRRELQEASAKIHEIAVSAGNSVEAIDKAQALLMGLSEDRTEGPKHIRDALPEWLDEKDRLFNADGELTGITTGIDALDDATGGAQRSDLIIIAGRPSMGKTSMAMNIAEAALEDGKTVAVFSMEMPTRQILDRLAASVGRVSLTRIRNPKLMEEADWTRITAAMTKIQDFRLHVDESPALTVTELRTRARRLHRRHVLDLVVVDYLQLMRSDSKENRTQEVSAISGGLKALAKELDVPVIALSQLNRSLENRANRRPVMSDLRESGALEQDADVILFLYRDEKYNPDTPDKGVAEIIIGKQRNGPTATVPSTFLGEYNRFENFTGSHYGEEAPQPKKRVGGFRY